MVITWFASPASYTGDDVVEISAHGSPVLLDRIVRSAMRAGARLAAPGEFTLRAFLNGKLDLVQAEAVADLIDAVTPAQARLAFDQLEGTLSHALAAIGEALFDLRVRLEASLDFPDEGYHFVEPGAVARECDAVRARVSALLETARRGRLLREGCTVALIGAPNVGKSLLFNALLGAGRAIVTPVAGTTRDLLTERCDIGGLPVAGSTRRVRDIARRSSRGIARNASRGVGRVPSSCWTVATVTATRGGWRTSPPRSWSPTSAICRRRGVRRTRRVPSPRRR